MIAKVKYANVQKRSVAITEASSEEDEYARFVVELLDAAKRFQKLDPWKQELPAAITHWLLSGGDTAEVLGKEFRFVWRQFIADYGINGYESHLSENNQLVLPFGITLGEILTGFTFPVQSMS